MKFLAGTWLEYYTYNRLKQHLDMHPEIQKIVQNPQAQVAESKESEQEFDLLYTDGYTLVIVECKTRPIVQDDIQKLENQVRNYAGSLLGRGALVTSLPKEKVAKPVTENRIRNSSISVFCGKSGIEELGKYMIDFRPKEFFGEQGESNDA